MFEVSHDQNQKVMKHYFRRFLKNVILRLTVDMYKKT